MGFIVALLVGGLAGWLAALLVPDRRGSTASTVTVGIIGALLGAFILGPLLGGGNIFESVFYPMTVVVTLIGAALLLGGVILFRRRRRQRRSAAGDRGDF